MRRVLVLATSVVAAVSLGYGALLLWNTQVHSARVAVVWLCAVVLGLSAAWADARLLRRAHLRVTLPVAVAVADVLLAIFGLATVLGIYFSGSVVGVLFGGAFGVPVILASWHARRRAIVGRLEGPAVLVGLLLLGSWAALSRPWTPESGQWSVLAAVAVAAAALVGGSTAVCLLRRAAVVE